MVIVFFGIVFGFLYNKFSPPKKEKSIIEERFTTSYKYYKIVDGIMSDTMSIETKIRIANMLFNEAQDHIKDIEEDILKTIKLPRELWENRQKSPSSVSID